MRKLLITTAGTLLLCLMTTSVSAGPPMTGNEWVGECKSNNYALRTYCLMYARGLADGLAVEAGVACIDDAVQAQQLADVGIQFIAKNPKDRHLPAGTLLIFAFAEAWPCKQQASSRNS